MRMFAATLFTMMLASSAARAAQVAIDPGEIGIGSQPIVRVWDDAGQTSVFFSPPTTLNLPNGATYHVTTYDQLREWGSFTIAADGTVAVTSGLVAAPSGGATALHFDLAGLTPVTVDPEELIVGNGSYVLKLNVQGGAAVAVLNGAVATLWLPNGGYDLTDYDVRHSYGVFTTAGGSIVSEGPSLSLDASNPDRLHFVLPEFGAITLPSIAQAPTGETLKLDVGAPLGDTVVTLWDGTGTAYLSDGSYELTDYVYNASFGTFVVQGGLVTSATGAYTAQAGALVFVPGALPFVTVTLAPGAYTRVGIVGPNGTPALTGYFVGSGTYTLPAGQYALLDIAGQPTFTVAADGSITSSLPAGFSAVNAHPTPAQQLDALIATVTDHHAHELLVAARAALQRGNLRAARNQLYALYLSTKDKALAASVKALIQALGG